MFQITHNTTTDSMHIADAGKEFEHSLRMVMEGYEYWL